MCSLYRLFFICIASFVFFPPGSVKASDSKRLVFYTGIQSPIRDILEKRLQEASKRIGRQFRMEFTGSSQRALVMANTVGDGDALRVSDIKKIAPENTTNLIMVPESLFEISFFVYTKDKFFIVDGWGSLKLFHNGFRVGIKILEKNIPGQTTLLPDSSRLFQMLDQERLDTVTEHGIIADAHIRRLKLKNMVKLTPPLVTFPGHCFIHKKHAELIPQLAASLAAMKKDGTFFAIRESVMLQPVGD